MDFPKDQSFGTLWDFYSKKGAMAETYSLLIVHVYQNNAIAFLWMKDATISRDIRNILNLSNNGSSESFTSDFINPLKMLEDETCEKIISYIDFDQKTRKVSHIYTYSLQSNENAGILNHWINNSSETTPLG